jgi:hypothetical protein
MRRREQNRALSAACLTLCLLSVWVTGNQAQTAGAEPAVAPGARARPDDASRPLNEPASARQKPGAAGQANSSNEVGSAGTTASSASAPKATSAAVPPPRVVDAYRDGKHSLAFDEEQKNFRTPDETRDECNKRPDSDDCRDRRTARLNEIVYIRIANLQTLLDAAKCLEVKDGKKERKANCQDREIVLFLNGRPIKGLFPESGAPELQPIGAGTLRYHLRRYEGTSATADAESDEHWADLLGLDPAGDQWRLTRDDVSLSVGLENEYPIATDVTNFRLRRMRGWFLAGFAVLAAVTLYLLFRLARESDLLRDRKPVLRGQDKPYSLAATQAAFWFVLTLMSFVFIWLVTGEYDLSTSVLVLLGIGLGTALGSQVIDQSKTGAPNAAAGPTSAELDALMLKKQQLEATLDMLDRDLARASAQEKPPIQAEVDAKKADYHATISEIATKFPNAIGPSASRFYLDLLSDAHGVNFHRFQMLAWTLILGLVFVYSVLSRLAMPKFSETLLMLMGISAGTYLGFKIPETTTTAPIAPPSVAQKPAAQPKPPVP